jgi:hypothetical protein
MKSGKKIDGNIVANLHFAIGGSLLSRIAGKKKRQQNDI